MLPNLTSRSLRAAIIKPILTISHNTMLAYEIVTSDSVMWPPVTSLAFCLKSLILMSNTMWHQTNWWPMGIGFPSGKTSNATLTFSISLDIASAHKVSTVSGSSMLNLWLFFKYWDCCILMLAISLSLLLSTCLIHQLKAGL